jgi:hypothetical protein
MSNPIRVAFLPLSSDFVLVLVFIGKQLVAVFVLPVPPKSTTTPDVVTPTVQATPQPNPTTPVVTVSECEWDSSLERITLSDPLYPNLSRSYFRSRPGAV